MEEHPEAQTLYSAESLDLDGISRRNWSKVQRLKRMVKFVMSVCVFSIVLGLFFSFFSLFPHSFTLYFSLFSLLNHAFDRKYMFLLCNGILFLLAAPSLHRQHGTSAIHPADLAAAGPTTPIEEEEEEEDGDGDGDGDGESAIHFCADMAAVGPTSPIEDEEEEEEEEGCFVEEGKRSEEMVSTEELNKRIEEFIRKMKEEMRIQAAEAAHTQLVHVN